MFQQYLIPCWFNNKQMADQSKFIWFNGKIVPWGNAQIHVMSHVLHYGSGVFEGMYPEFNECPENEEGNGKCLTISGRTMLDLLPQCAEYRWSVNDNLYYEFSWEAIEFGYQTICVPYGQTTLKLEYRACEGDWKECLKNRMHIFVLLKIK
mgnify:CR=1 FL=1